MSELRVTLVQTALHWEQPATNRQQLAQKIGHLHGHTDLIVLPEMCTTGFSMNAATLAEPMDGPTVAWFRTQAAALESALVGSFICVENGQYYNRLIFVQPDGVLHTYDKRHLFGLASEDKTYTAGSQQTYIEWKGWRIRPCICYDLRFPVWSRQPNDPHRHYDLLLYVANWPARRAAQWRALLTARAIENQAFVAGVNIVGQDGAGLDYQGDSTLLDYAGANICQLSFGEGVFTGKLSLVDLQKYRSQLPFLADSDAFSWG